jgi:hypothetical protein
MAPDEEVLKEIQGESQALEASQSEQDEQIPMLISEFLKMPPEQQERMRMETQPYPIKRRAVVDDQTDRFKFPEINRK